MVRGVKVPSANVDVKGTEPVRRTVRMPRVNRVRPRERQKYSSSARAAVSSGSWKRCNGIALYPYV